MSRNPDEEPTVRRPRDPQEVGGAPESAAHSEQQRPFQPDVAPHPQPSAQLTEALFAPAAPVATALASRAPASAPRSRRRLILTAIISSVVALALVLACLVIALLPRPSAITICAQGELTNQCETGAIRAVGHQQTVRVQVALGGFSLIGGLTRLVIDGANPQGRAVTPDSHGVATFTYAGARAGRDTITATLSLVGIHLSASVTIDWLTPRHLFHPMIFLHGVNENEAPIASQLNPAQPADSSVEWSALLRMLTIEYNPQYIQAFCYLDDYAWTMNPAGCPSVETMNCTHTNPSTTLTTQACVSQSPIRANALALAQVINALYLSEPAGSNKPVTLIGYSMGAMITRTMLTICNPALAEYDPTCPPVIGKVDQAFFFNGAQQGSWLLQTKHDLDVASLAEQGLNTGGIDNAFSAVLPSMEQSIFGAINASIKLNVANEATTDLTPLSAILQTQNAADADPTTLGIKFYTFYGDIRLGMSVSVLGYHLAASQQLPLGDLLLLPQDDQPLGLPEWGGASLCGLCGQLANGYHQAGPYHEWALTDIHTIDISGLAPILTAPNAVSALAGVLTSPVQHLNVETPLTQEPGSRIQVNDITGRYGAQVDMPTEVLTILLQSDGQSGL